MSILSMAYLCETSRALLLLLQFRHRAVHQSIFLAESTYQEQLRKRLVLMH